VADGGEHGGDQLTSQETCSRAGLPHFFHQTHHWQPPMQGTSSQYSLALMQAPVQGIDDA
jgi:hypothetical protein